jgi:hypothetical protein
MFPSIRQISSRSPSIAVTAAFVVIATDNMTDAAHAAYHTRALRIGVEIKVEGREEGIRTRTNHPLPSLPRLGYWILNDLS